MSKNIDIVIQQFKETATDNRNEEHYWRNRPNSNANTLEYAQKACKRAEENEQIVAWLTELQERREADRWIPVSERLPNTLGVYNVTRKIIEGETSYVISDACYFDGQNTWHADTGVNHGRPYITDVIAWKPLPKPYESEDK